MKRTACWRAGRGFIRCLLACCIAGLVLTFLVERLIAATSPKISYIERWSVNGTNGVLLHFDTDANRTYALQATDKLVTNAVWTNLYTAPNLPFTGHYIVPDLRPGNHFYRLHVTP
jgi:hypothetical protein